MKNKIFPIICASLLLFVVSCKNDFLQYTQSGAASTDNFWKTESDAKLAANGLYSFLTNDDIVGRGFMWYIDACDDMVVGRDKAQAVNMKNFVDAGSNSYTSLNWPTMYQIIKRANDIIIHVPQMDISQDVKNSVLGQAYFFRAWAYMWLASRYGDQRAGLPIVEPTLSVNIDSLDIPRAKNVSVNYLYCINDWKKAASLLPYFDELGTADYGRPHKTACWAYIAKAYLYNAEWDASSYAHVVDYADSVIESGKHALLANYGDVFKIANNWSKEYIWSFVSNNIAGSITPSVFLENKGWGKYNGWGYWHATLELYNEFEANDPRREVTILKYGDKFVYFGDTMRYWSTNNRTGFQFNKFMDPFRDSDPVGHNIINPNGDEPTTTLNVPLIRYAEVLLFKAEGLIMQGKNGDEPLNEVRARVGLPPKTNATMDDLKHERRVELAGEWADRHYDLVRWHDAEKVYAQPLHGQIHTDLTNPDSPYTIQEVWPVRKFDPVINHVWPIPPAEIQASKVLKQNEGY
ncbi:MAG TPA: RagB/SusD family nutrient uptake outer membrane protein [Bacteroidales bacterium]